MGGKSKLYEPSAHHWLSIKCQTDTVNNYLANMVEHLAAEEPDISHRRCWRPKMELKDRKYWTYIYQVSTNLILKLLYV